MEREGKGPDDGVPTLVERSTPFHGEPLDGEELAKSLARYKMGDMLGRGGMGEVVSARDEQIGRDVAIKRLRDGAPTRVQQALFLREARIQGRLGHPAVVPVHELRRDAAGKPFFVMRQLEGVTLSEVIKKQAAGDGVALERFPRARLLRAFAEVCLAIEFAHTRGVVHRDLKPANIVLGEFGEVYVLDWGVAHVMDGSERRSDFEDVQTIDDSLRVDGMILGSPGYMSPEQIRAEHELDGRSDVYALGCILFEILALQPLHETGLAGIALALTGVDARPTVRAPDRDTPPELERICVSATMIDRRDRYASARELGDAVQRFLDGDRDLALRKELAVELLADAQRAFARGNRATERRDAIRAAARALALDPTNRDAADLVGRMMLEPPAEVPREVEEALDRGDDDALYAARRLIIQAAIAYLAFFPVLYLVGFRDPWFLAAGVAIAGAMGVLAFTSTREHVRVIAYTGLIGNSLMTLLLSWCATPFFVAPAIGVITAMSIGTHPRVARGWVLVTVIAASVLAPLGLEVLGLIRQTTLIAGDTVTLRIVATGLEHSTMMLTLVGYVVVLLMMAVILAKSLTADRRLAQRIVQIQTWQLRQLVPQAS